MVTEDPKFIQAERWLRQLIAAGDVSIGGRLPTLRELGEKFDVAGVQTLRNAYEPLIREGVVEARQGAGYYLSRYPEMGDGLVSGDRFMTDDQRRRGRGGDDVLAGSLRRSRKPNLTRPLNSAAEIRAFFLVRATRLSLADETATERAASADWIEGLVAMMDEAVVDDFERAYGVEAASFARACLARRSRLIPGLGDDALGRDETAK